MMDINDFFLLFCNSLFAGDAANDKVIASGTTGDCSWALTANDAMTISGNGIMEDIMYNKDKKSKNLWGETPKKTKKRPPQSFGYICFFNGYKKSINF